MQQKNSHASLCAIHHIAPTGQTLHVNFSSASAALPSGRPSCKRIRPEPLWERLSRPFDRNLSVLLLQFNCKSGPFWAVPSVSCLSSFFVAVPAVCCSLKLVFSCCCFNLPFNPSVPQHSFQVSFLVLLIVQGRFCLKLAFHRFCCCAQTQSCQDRFCFFA